ncbi:PCRF domain-containing protein, partial [Patescibacteria group bacterium]|nr:PCRF domain-containing protein [Patescibacteria group bacterium]
MEESKELIAANEDAEMVEMALEEKNIAEEKIPELEKAITVELLPKDPNDDKNIFLEIRPAAGGDE